MHFISIFTGCFCILLMLTHSTVGSSSVKLYHVVVVPKNICDRFIAVKLLKKYNFQIYRKNRQIHGFIGKKAMRNKVESLFMELSINYKFKN
uniref:Uncharacterized protein n=1 Tax=Schmidtea mediterranea TaxID=79327 RepID=A0A5P8I4M6_SCHMD|nr:hypothetical protein [Schmidtea mediterranea]